MANRFSVGDTLGGQLYSKVVQDQTAQYLREKALEEERQRREAERRRQEEQRRKASKHSAFGQTLSTLGQIGGAIAGGFSTGTPQGAIVGSQLGSAGASTLMNFFPNVAGTEPDQANPYYDKPSNMAKVSSALNLGLQSYGTYSKAMQTKARENLLNEIKADMSRPRMMIDESARLGQSADPNYFNYKSATASEIADRIKTLPSYQDASGLFGESLVNDETALSIANTTYDAITNTATQHLEFLTNLENNREKVSGLENWQNVYGSHRSNLIPKYGMESIVASTKSGIEDAATTKEREALTFTINYGNKVLSNKQAGLQIQKLETELAEAPEKRATERFMALSELKMKYAEKSGEWNPITNVDNVRPELVTDMNNLGQAVASSYAKAQTAKATAQTQKLEQEKFKLTVKVLESIPFDQTELRSSLIKGALDTSILGSSDKNQFNTLLKNVGPKADKAESASKYSSSTKVIAEYKVKELFKGFGQFDTEDPKTTGEIKALVLQELKADPNDAVNNYIIEEILSDPSERVKRLNVKKEVSQNEGASRNVSTVQEALRYTDLPYVNNNLKKNDKIETPSKTGIRTQFDREVFENKSDGKYSEKSITIELNGVFYHVPTVDEEGKPRSKEFLVKHIQENGPIDFVTKKPLEKFRSREEADAYAEERSVAIAQFINGGNNEGKVRSASQKKPTKNAQFAQYPEYLKFLSQLEAQVDQFFRNETLRTPNHSGTHLKYLIIEARKAIKESQDSSLPPSRQQAATDSVIPLLTRINALIEANQQGN